MIVANWLKKAVLELLRFALLLLMLGIVAVTLIVSQSLINTLIVLLSCICSAVFVLGYAHYRRRNRERRAGMQEIDHMDHEQFLRWTADLLRAHKYKVETVAPDHGEDSYLIAEKNRKTVFVQVKVCRSRIGTADYQVLEDRRDRERFKESWMVTNRGFAKEVLKHCQRTNQIVLDRTRLTNMVLSLHRKAKTADFKTAVKI